MAWSLSSDELRPSSQSLEGRARNLRATQRTRQQLAAALPMLLVSAAFAGCSLFHAVGDPPPPSATSMRLPLLCTERSDALANVQLIIYEMEPSLESSLEQGLNATFELLCSGALEPVLTSVSSNVPWCDGKGRKLGECPCAGTDEVAPADLVDRVLASIPPRLHIIAKDPGKGTNAETRRRPRPVAMAVDPARIARWESPSQRYLLIDTLAHELTHLVGTGCDLQAFQDSTKEGRERMVSYRFGLLAGCVFRHPGDLAAIKDCAAVAACTKGNP